MLRRYLLLDCWGDLDLHVHKLRGGYLLYSHWVTLVYSLFCRYLLFGSWCFGFVNMRELCSR